MCFCRYGKSAVVGQLPTFELHNHLSAEVRTHVLTPLLMLVIDSRLSTSCSSPKFTPLLCFDYRTYYSSENLTPAYARFSDAVVEVQARCMRTEVALPGADLNLVVIDARLL